MQRVVAIDIPLDLRGTLGPLQGEIREDGWWYSSRTPEGPGTIRVTRTRLELRGVAWGEGGSYLLERLGAIAGLDDRAVFTTDHPLISRLHRRSPGMRFGATGDVFGHLVEAVVGQKVTRTEASRALRGLRSMFSAPAPGPAPGLRLPPDPVSLRRAPYWDFHTLGLEKRRADAIKAIASESDRIRSLAGSSTGSAERFLLAIPGIGPWSVAETLVRSHGDPDQLSVGDFHLKNLVSHHLAGRARGTDEEMVELLEEFRPHRARVVRLLHGLGHAPKFGPRLAPRSITHI